MPMKNPPHPGGFVLRQCIEPLGLSITAAAAALGVTRTTLSELVNGKRGISPEMAVRLSQVFGGSGWGIANFVEAGTLTVHDGETFHFRVID